MKKAKQIDPLTVEGAQKAQGRLLKELRPRDSHRANILFSVASVGNKQWWCNSNAWQELLEAVSLVPSKKELPDAMVDYAEKIIRNNKH